MTNPKKYSWGVLSSEKLSEGITRKLIYGERVMLAEIRLKKGTVVPEHHHESEQVSWVIKGELLFEMEGEDILVKEGEVLVIPSHRPHKVTAKEDTVDVDIFSPIREDWLSGQDQYLKGNSR